MGIIMTLINKALLVDSHCHLHSIDLIEFDNDIGQVIRLAHENGVEHMLCVCVEKEDIQALYKLAEKYSEISISVGIHPNIIMSEEFDAAAIVKLAEHKSCIAIGETGLDYYRSEDKSVQEIQISRFREHIRAAITTSKPLIIHTRQAANDTLRVMEEESAQDIGGVMHCFSENWDVAKRALDLNFYISFSGILTFNSANELREVAKNIPLDRILIETDAPYLAPVPFRGKQNHPALVKHVAEALSKIRGLDYETIAAKTTENFYRCFRKERL